MIEQLADIVWKEPAFRTAYRQVTAANLASSLNIATTLPADFHEDVLPRLLESAAILAGGAERRHREAAYRIVVAAWILFGGTYDGLVDVTRVVFGRLGNFPAIGRLTHLSAGATERRLPVELWFEITARERRNTITLAHGTSLPLTDFQRRLWDTVAAGDPVSVSAPTSAGKSFVMKRHVATRMLSDLTEFGIYIVPTRALINQVSTDMAALFRQLGPAAPTDLLLSDVPAVFTVPIPPSELGASRGLYVLTQERTQILLETAPELAFGLIIVDEAQAVGDSGRGVILQSVLERLVERSPGAQVLFGSPPSSNPGIYKRLFGLRTLEPVEEPESPVAQNLLFVDTDPVDRRRVAVRASVDSRLFIDGVDAEGVPLGDAQTVVSITDNDKQTLAALGWTFGRAERSLVYAGGPAACEEIAGLLLQLADEEEWLPSETPVEELDELAVFIREHVHPAYSLAAAVGRGIGFHYGDMPAIVRRLIEDYFADGKLAFLVCTSTLLQGVNLPAKNLFLLNPTKGRDEPISSIDFWNLAGRAGRLGKDFEGNIFLIDRARWKADPLTGDTAQEVTPSLEATLVNRSEEFVAFIRNRDHPSGSKQTTSAENTFVKLVNEARRGRLAERLGAAFRGARPDMRSEIEALISEAAADIRVPMDVTEKNIYVSVFRQDEMLRYLEQRIEQKGPDYLLPLHPRSPGDPFASLAAIFARIHRYFEKHPTPRQHRRFARLALAWMRGQPLPRIIEEVYQHELGQKAKEREKGRRVRDPQVGKVIRDVMGNIEDDLRFRYVKYTSCYNDLLRVAFENTGHSHRVSSIPKIPLYLELGAASDTMVNLIGIGFHRTTAGALAGRAVNPDMTRPETERWLRRERWEDAGLSPIFLREIRALLGVT